MNQIVNPDTKYRISRDLKISIRDGCHLIITVEAGQYDFPMSTLGLLEQFVYPMTFGEAAKRIASGGTNDWIHKTSILRSLVEIAALEPENIEKQAPKASLAYGSARIHIDMLNDQTRTQAYQRAVRDLVKPGDTVVDIGTGTGVLAITAAFAGAKKVYALEANPTTAEIARFCIEENGVSDRVEVIEGWSTNVDIPEPVDLVVSEMFGNDPFDEDILLIYADAVKRFAKADAKLIPQGFDLCCAPLMLLPKHLCKHIPDNEMLLSWKNNYDIDFSILAKLEYSDDLPLFYSRPQDLAPYIAFDEKLCLGYVDLTESQPLSPEFGLPTKGLSGSFNALMLYFDTELSPGNRLNLAPQAASNNNHWRMPVWYLHKTLDFSEHGNRKICFERTNTGKNRLFIK